MTDTGDQMPESSVHGDAETDLTRERTREEDFATTGAAGTAGTAGVPAGGAMTSPAMGGPAVSGGTGMAGTQTAGGTGMDDPGTGDAGMRDTPAATGAGMPDASRTGTGSGTGTASAPGGHAPLLGDVDTLAMQWQSVQVTFVDEPRRAVQDADRLVREVMDRLSEVFRSQREDLEHAWNAGDQASTEDLRVALQRYRSFFERLLAA